MMNHKLIFPRNINFTIFYTPRGILLDINVNLDVCNQRTILFEKSVTNSNNAEIVIRHLKFMADVDNFKIFH